MEHVCQHFLLPQDAYLILISVCFITIQVTQGELHMMIQGSLPKQRPTQLSAPSLPMLGYSLLSAPSVACIGHSRAADSQRQNRVQSLSLPAWYHSEAAFWKRLDACWSVKSIDYFPSLWWIIFLLNLIQTSFKKNKPQPPQDVFNISTSKPWKTGFWI